jgi:hypothetical protein
MAESDARDATPDRTFILESFGGHKAYVSFYCTVKRHVSLQYTKRLRFVNRSGFNPEKKTGHATYATYTGTETSVLE